MNRDRVPFFISISILVASSVLLYQNNKISDLNTENDELTQYLSEQTQQIQTLQAQIIQLSETSDLLDDSLTATLESINLANDQVHSSYVRVSSIERIVYAYLFREKINCTYSVNYSFPGPTTTVFSILDTDQITVLGYEVLSLDGAGIATVTVEIPLPVTSGKWSISPSVYWLKDDTPTYSSLGWSRETSFDVLDVDPGHTLGSCGEQSTACHSG
jgi:hypothetical protein